MKPGGNDFADYLERHERTNLRLSGNPPTTKVSAKAQLILVDQRKLLAAEHFGWGDCVMAGKKRTSLSESGLFAKH